MKLKMQRCILVILVLLISASGIGLVWKSQELIVHHQTYIAREGMWPTMETERTLLNLKEILVRISLGETVAEEEYLLHLKIASNRVSIIYQFAKNNPNFSKDEMILVGSIHDSFQKYYLVQSSGILDSDRAKHLVPLIESAISSSHNLLNSRRDITYKSNVETFSYIGQLLTWLSITLFLLVVASATIYFSNQQALRQEIKIVQLQRQAAEQEKEVAISRTRVTMASELHDVLNYHLAIIAQKLSRAHDQLHTNSAITRNEILEARARTMLALRDARGSIHALRSGNIQPLDRAIKALDSGGMGLHVEVVGHPLRLPDDLAFAVYRITQEAFANTIKHAHLATSISVTLSYEIKHFMLTVQDDGRSLSGSREDERVRTSIGLIGMQERVEQLRGIFQHGATHQGYYIQAIFPMELVPHDSHSSPDCGRSSDISTNDSRQS